MTSKLRGMDWGELAPLRLRAQTVADGVYAGVHRSARRGAGIEFGGHRAYTPGDDLRWLDRRALMRHGRLLVRQFETETDRSLRLLIDASASMGFRSNEAPGAKLAYAALIGAALARIALSTGDPVALDWLGGEANRPLPAMSGREAFERLLGALEDVEPGGDLSLDPAAIDRAIAPIARNARRGSVIVVLSDLLDLPEGTLERLVALSTRGRTLIAVRVLDPVEESFPFDGPLRLRAVEGGALVETDGQLARAGYLESLERIAARWEDRLIPHGGRLVRCTSADSPIRVVQDILALPAGGRS